MVEIVRIIGRAVHRIIGLNIATGHWRVGFADNNGHRRLSDARRDHRVRCGDMAFIVRKTGVACQPLNFEQVLYRHRHAVQRAFDIAFGDCVICRFGLFKSCVKARGNNRVNRRIVFFNAVYEMLCRLFRRNTACGYFFRPVRAPVIYAVSFHPSLWTRRSALGKLAPVKNVPSRTIGRKTCSVKCKTFHY